jgi:hypothetical protein
VGSLVVVLFIPKTIVNLGLCSSPGILPSYVCFSDHLFSFPFGLIF